MVNKSIFSIFVNFKFLQYFQKLIFFFLILIEPNKKSFFIVFIFKCYFLLLKLNGTSFKTK